MEEEGWRRRGGWGGVEEFKTRFSFRLKFSIDVVFMVLTIQMILTEFLQILLKWNLLALKVLVFKTPSPRGCRLLAGCVLLRQDWHADLNHRWRWTNEKHPKLRLTWGIFAAIWNMTSRWREIMWQESKLPNQSFRKSNVFGCKGCIGTSLRRGNLSYISLILCCYVKWQQITHLVKLLTIFLIQNKTLHGVLNVEEN